ncbi:MAG: S9 family peptidase [Actinomycetota bacterium]
MQGFQPEDIYDLVKVTDPRLSPDARRVAFVVKTIDREANDYKSQVWVGGTEGYAPFTGAFTGGAKDGVPRWSPDGRWLAYVKNEDAGGRLMIAPLDGGESRCLCEFTEGIESLEWSPDSTHIALLTRDRDDEVYRHTQDRDKPPRIISRILYRLDDVGWTIDRPLRLFLIEVSEGNTQPKALTERDARIIGFSWAPDGKSIAFAGARHETWDLDLRTDLFLLDIETLHITQITEPKGFYSQPSFSPDGSEIAFEWSSATSAEAFHGRVGVLNLASKQIRILTNSLDRNASTYPAVREPIWSGNDIYFSIEDSGNMPVYKVRTDGSSAPQEVIGGDRQITGLDLRRDTHATVWTDATELASVWVGDECLWSGASLDDRELVSPERFTAMSKDGSEVEAWIIRPANFDADTKYPMLLNIHGGPFTQYGNGFFDEFHSYAGAGYVVVYSNPRGSAGYSQAWGQAINGPKTQAPGTGWGTVDFEDLMAVTDEAIERFPFIDAERTGVLGGSYGGYMASWIVGHTDRFKAAISERAVNNMLTQGYACDYATYYSRAMGAAYFEDHEEYLRQSPITYVKNITTPLLIIHSENDLRCPIEHAEELFTALKLLGREVEFARFPGEGHEMSRSGAPRHRVQRMKMVIDWFDQYLKSQTIESTG